MRLMPIFAAVVLVVVLAGVAVASGVVSFADPPKPAAVAAQSAAPAAAPPAVTPTVDLDAARAQLMTDESQMCNCGR
jgi:hypothetical protein